MSMKTLAAFAVVLGMNTLVASGASAQDVPASPEQPRAASGPEWRIVSRGAERVYLLDLSSRTPVEDALTIRVARIPMTTAAGDYSHTVETFAVRCDADQTRVIETKDVIEDGETGDTYASDEPWADVQAGTRDDGIKQIACDEARLEGDAFTTIRAYFDAGRP